MNSLQGFLLVASPALADPNFRKTVILIVRHSSEDGALGLVLNRETSTTIKELWERMGQENCASHQPLSLGGPCEGPLMALHTEQPLAEIEVLPGLYFTAGSDQLQTLVASPSPLAPTSSAMPAGARDNWKWNSKEGRGARNLRRSSTFSERTSRPGSARSAKRQAGRFSPC